MKPTKQLTTRTSRRLPVAELNSVTLEVLREIANAPDDIQSIIKSSGLSRNAFEWLVRKHKGQMPASLRSVLLEALATMPSSGKPRKAKQISAAEKPRSKDEFYSTIAEHNELSRKQVAGIFETMSEILAADLGKNGPGIINVAGLMKVTVVRKPATEARKGINPFTKQEVTFKRKPARNVVKVRALKFLKDLL